MPRGGPEPYQPTNPSRGLSLVEKSVLMYALRRILTMQLLSGYKVRLGAFGAMLTGAGMIVAAVVEMINTGTITFDHLQTGLGVFWGGWMAWGFGHKMEKAMAASSGDAPPTP